MLDQKKHNDAFYSVKHSEELLKGEPMYDLTISNFHDRLFIDLRDPELIREFYSMDGS